MRKSAYRMALAATCMLAPIAAGAQAVIFPQTQQAGTAQAAEVEGGYTLSNDLLTATFLLDQSKHLSFGGCPELGLKAGTDLFTIEYQDGTVLNSGSIEWESVEKGVDTSIDPDAVRTSLKMPGKMIEAKATLANGLKLTWRAVLRDGSHYLRTEIELTNPEDGSDVAMHQLTPMIFTADRSVTGNIAVVGNTRGAILASPKIFAGLETPMGVNSVADHTNTVNNLKLDGWSAAADWTAWKPTELPTDESFPKSFVDGNNTRTVSLDKTDGMHGYVYFLNAGEQNISFQYQGGNQGLNILGVDATNVETTAKAADYRHQFTGGSKNTISYTLDIPVAGVYEVAVYRSSHDNFNGDPRGNITFPEGALLATVSTSADVTEPTVSLTTSGPETPELSTRWVTADFATPAANTEIPAGVKAMIANQTANNSWVYEYDSSNFTLSEESSALKVKFHYTSGGHGRKVAGAEVVDNEGNVVASKYAISVAGGNGDAEYTFDTAIPAGTYKIHAYSAHNFGSSLNANNNGTCTIYNGETQIATQNYTGSTDWTVANATSIPNGVLDAMTGTHSSDAATEIYSSTRVISRPLAVAGEGTTDVNVTVTYTGGSSGLDIMGVALMNEENEFYGDYHIGNTGNSHTNNQYTITGVPAGNYTLKVYASMRNQSNLPTAGTFAFSDNVTAQPQGEATVTAATVTLPLVNDVEISGQWVRHTALKPGKTWEVGAVVGLIAQNEGQGADQTRRSVLAYIERERAMPWKPMVIYNSWYELNINRNNAYDHSGNMTATDCERIVNQWREHLYDENGTNIGAFVWDDGWDEYGTWTFNSNFPNGFKEPDDAARAMGTGIGAWLGPVGGYGTSGTYRRNYWNGKGGMQLSNPAYYQVFLNAVTNLTKNYDFRYFKFDGISAQGTAHGPDGGYTGFENAEGIIDIESQVRKIKPDIFLNTTVGTWASPFWYRYTDATWRQDADWATHGNQGTKREQWITYRDKMVHQIYVTESPLCPINNLMTHGVIVTKFGPPAAMDNNDYDGIVREIRAAFACGSAQVELYTDYELLNALSRGTEGEEGYKAPGAVWADLAEAIKWQRDNADVLPDIHWVGGNPANAEVYGWASWNGRKATLALRNPKASEQTFTINLRSDLELPGYCSSTFTFKKSFADQADLAGFDLTASYGADQSITVTLPANSIYVFDGIDSGYADVPAPAYEIVVDNIVELTANATVAPAIGGSVKLNVAVTPAPIAENTTISVEAAPAADGTVLATVEGTTVTFVAGGTTTITVKAVADGKEIATLEIPVTIADPAPRVEPQEPDADALHESITYTPGAEADNEETPEIDERIATLAIALTAESPEYVEIPATVRNTDAPADFFEFRYDGATEESAVARAEFVYDETAGHRIKVSHKNTDGLTLITLHRKAEQTLSRAADDAADDALWKLYVTVSGATLNTATSISLTGVPSQLYLCQSFTVGATVEPASSTDPVKWSFKANPEDAVTVVDNGNGTYTVTAVKEGTLTVTATLASHAADAVATSASHTLTLRNATGNPGEGVTGIDAVNADAAEGRAEIYDLAGRRLRRITAAGMYIVNGVKTIVR